MRKLASTTITLLALASSGCMIGPDYLRPVIDSPQSWRVSDETAKDLANSAWWEQFNDPVLNDLIAGVLVLALVTAVGGGTIRDLCLGVRPVFWIEQPQVVEHPVGQRPGHRHGLGKDAGPVFAGAFFHAFEGGAVRHVR